MRNKMKTNCERKEIMHELVRIIYILLLLHTELIETQWDLESATARERARQRRRRAVFCFRFIQILI